MMRTRHISIFLDVMNLIDFNIIGLQILEENNFKEILECDCNQINLVGYGKHCNIQAILHCKVCGNRYSNKEYDLV